MSGAMLGAGFTMSLVNKTKLMDQNRSSEVWTSLQLSKCFFSEERGFGFVVEGWEDPLMCNPGLSFFPSRVLETLKAQCRALAVLCKSSWKPVEIQSQEKSVHRKCPGQVEAQWTQATR